jgi:hypothetical protein
MDSSVRITSKRGQLDLEDTLEKSKWSGLGTY